MPSSTRSAAICLALLAAPAAGAEEIPTLRELGSVRSAGMGGAARGFASGNEALLVNPAGMSAVSRFNFGVEAFFEPASGLRVLSVAAVDSKLNADQPFALAGGVGYYDYRVGEGDQARKGSLTVVGLSVPLALDLVSVGVAARYLKLSGAVKSNSVTMDSAILLRPNPLLGLSAVGYNLIDVRSPEAPRAWGLGAAFGSDATFLVDLDARLDSGPDGETVASFFAGAEYTIAGMFVPRLGFGEDRLRRSREVSGGLTFIWTILGVEAAYRHALGGRGRAFGFSLRLLDWPETGE